jgi:hypothetical protein
MEPAEKSHNIFLQLSRFRLEVAARLMFDEEQEEGWGAISNQPRQNDTVAFSVTTGPVARSAVARGDAARIPMMTTRPEGRIEKPGEVKWRRTPTTRRRQPTSRF